MNIRNLTISPAVRISFGLAMFTISVMLIADLLGIVPNQDKMLLESRQKISESLAVQLSVAATTNNQYILDAVLKSFVKRNDDVVAAAMTKENGEVISKFGEFSILRTQNNGNSKSNIDNIFVPIFNGSERWGTINIEFINTKAVGVFGFMTQTPIGMLLFIFISCLIGYMYILRNALKVLDPKAVVPERVRAAFNALSEGVLILDKKEQIMMANDAFTKQIDKDADQLIGMKASSLKLKVKVGSDEERLPWINTIDKGSNRVGVPLDLSSPSMGVRSVSTNCAPIIDESGSTRGALVTFDDITDVEESNIKLESAVDLLQQSDVEIRRKNQELEVLASRDSLTGCYNRRAFFEMFEDEFQSSQDNNKNLCCIMLDIDHFKTINDRFGHGVGDEVLRMISEIINSCDYKDAIVGRYGGEEFCIALPDATISIAKQLADDLRSKIKKASHEFCDAKTIISASFGISISDDSMENYSIMLEQADNALYKAKNCGRDCVVAWEESENLKDSNEENIPIEIAIEDSSIDNQSRQLHDRIHFLESVLEEKDLQLDKIKLHDPVTGLPTRFIFEDRVKQSIALTERNNNVIAVVVLNIDMFSRINNTLGQVVGDQFLKSVGHRLKTVMRRTDTVTTLTSESAPEPSLSRLRDDEFALLLTGFDSIESLTYVVKRIQKEVAGKITVSGNDLYITATIGLAVCPGDGNTSTQLVERAQTAQKQAKEISGRNNYMFYSQEIQQKISNRMKRELDIHKALDKKEFYMVYQPKLELKTGVIDSMEALIRWNHPQQGLISPNEFIPQAEDAGLIVEIGEWTMRTVCQQIKKWNELGATNLRVSVNVSAVEFSSFDFVNKVSGILKETGVDASNLELEITETTVMSNTGEAEKIINELRFRNVTVTLDDFGTGYSSLNYLGNMNFDWIKIDRTFMLEAMCHPRSKILYGGIVKMAQDIGLKVVSEGIETQDEYDYVKELGVDELQGYILHKPLDLDGATDVLFGKAAGVKKAV